MPQNFFRNWHRRPFYPIGDFCFLNRIENRIKGFTEAKWKGRIAIESTDAEWMGGLVNALGEQRGMSFFKKLSEQKPDVRKGHILLAQMVAAGETD
ncbi:hypothetical protein EBS67_08185, partial [bacterium]|nr:hypothetical protein [bacterium]